MTGDFAGIIFITTESEQLLQQRLIHPLRFEDCYNKYIQVYAYLRVKDFDKGLQLAEAYLPSFHPSTNNWFAYMENYLLMAVHAQQYDLALRLMKQVDNNAAFQEITKRSKETWTLYRAYLYLVYPPDKLPPSFKLKNITQAVPQITKDKQGFNVTILILQFLYELRIGDLDLLQCRVESLKQYTKRYLSERNARRSRLFIRLLALVVAHQLNAVGCRKKGEKLFHQLSTTASPGDAFAEIEIVPYEHLWEWVLRTIEKK